MNTPVPFNLTESRRFDVFGWDSWPADPTPAVTQLRWNATTGNYEVLPPGAVAWSRLEARPDLQFGDPPTHFDVFEGGTLLPFFMNLSAPPHTPPADRKYVGLGRTWAGQSATAFFAFGSGTEPGDMPIGGRKTCSFGEDEIGGGDLTFDFSTGTFSGWAEPFWARVRYTIRQTSFRRGAATFSATFGDDGVLEGQFFGPRAANIAVRARRGSTTNPFAGVNGVMAGICE